LFYKRDRGTTRKKGARQILKRILRSRLPERLAHRVPPAVVEIGIGLLSALLFLAVRVALIPVAGDRAPYSFVFLGIVISALLAGWRSGAVTLITGQILAWTVIASRATSLPVGAAERWGALIIASFSQAVILLIIALYQREVAKNAQERERRVELLDQARREIDHRAKNNYQTVLSLVELQAARAEGPATRDALRQVADRIAAISVATEHLAIRNEDLSTVRLRDHLCGLCTQLERGLARGEIQVECDVADVVASADTATQLAIIVNELVTNALKHAFADGRRGVVRVQSKLTGKGLELEVSDNGCGIDGQSPSAGSGLGRKLVDNFARHLNAKHDVSSSADGTVHRLMVPALA
jgi:two-component sensor histidine kinase